MANRPFNMGMNAAKRIARRADKRDQKTVQQQLGVGLPRQHSHHQELVKMRHRYYAERYEENQRERAKAAANTEIAIGSKVFIGSSNATS